MSKAETEVCSTTKLHRPPRLIIISNFIQLYIEVFASLLSLLISLCLLLVYFVFVLCVHLVASPGFVARGDKAGNYVMAHSRADFRAGCSSCSMTNSFVTNAVLIERAVSC